MGCNKTYSKESHVSKLYRELVYCPFIESIRTTQYGHESGAEIADHLTVASWMDGANGQLKLITSEECMDKEKKLKITSNKQSAARTGVEQAADVGPNFKLLKAMLKVMDNPHQSSNPLVMRLLQILDELDDDSDRKGNVVRLKSHKKKASMATIPNFPVATGLCYTIISVRKGFIYNGMLDPKTATVAFFDNLLHTYCGNLEQTCLADKKRLMKLFFFENVLEWLYLGKYLQLLQYP